MNATDLMLGDWVYNSSKEKCKVYAISNIFDSNIHLDNYDKPNDGCFELAFEVEPILLTSEILEKNGFKKTQIYGEKQNDIFQCFDGETIIEVGIYDPNFISIHYRYETPDGINSGELSSIVKVDGGKFYLHELQHALRLCGIEKEIVL